MLETTGQKHIKDPEQLVLFEEETKIFFDGETKLCNKCNEWLPLDKFSNHSGANYNRPECRKCNAELTKVRNVLREKHGMPGENYTCPICLGTEEDVAGKGNKKNGPWVLDHCHETSSFRGWLCHKCNRSLGGFNDDKKFLKRAVKYLG